MIIVLLNDDPIKCKGCISTLKQYKCKLVNWGVTKFKYSKILQMFYKEGNTSRMWAGRQHENKENECVVCLRLVSLKALLCLNALQTCECVAALFVFNHRSRNERHKQTRCTMGAGRSSLPRQKTTGGSLVCARLHLSLVHWLDMAAALSDPFTKVATLECVHTHIHTYTQFLVSYTVFFKLFDQQP